MAQEDIYKGPARCHMTELKETAPSQIAFRPTLLRNPPRTDFLLSKYWNLL